MLETADIGELLPIGIRVKLKLMMLILTGSGTFSEVILKQSSQGYAGLR
jgi:hypothetical protein